MTDLHPGPPRLAHICERESSARLPMLPRARGHSFMRGRLCDLTTSTKAFVYVQPVVMLARKVCLLGFGGLNVTRAWPANPSSRPGSGATAGLAFSGGGPSTLCPTRSSCMSAGRRQQLADAALQVTPGGDRPVIQSRRLGRHAMSPSPSSAWHPGSILDSDPEHAVQAPPPGPGHPRHFAHTNTTARQARPPQRWRHNEARVGRTERPRREAQSAPCS